MGLSPARPEDGRARPRPPARDRGRRRALPRAAPFRDRSTRARRRHRDGRDRAGDQGRASGSARHGGGLLVGRGRARARERRAPPARRRRARGRFRGRSGRLGPGRLEPAVRRPGGMGHTAAGDPRVGAARRARRRRPARGARNRRGHAPARARGRRVPVTRRGRKAHVARVRGRPCHARPGRHSAGGRRTPMSDAVAALRARRPVVLPFDTVYGLAAEPHDEASTRALYELKGRVETQPTALVAASVDALATCLPELDVARVRHLLPGALTLVVANPAHRFLWLTGTNPDALGVRVPQLSGPTRAVLDEVGAVVATSANHPGGPDPRRLEDVPAQIRAGAAALLDAGELPGTPSTVVDLTGPEPRILREGAVPAEEVLRRLQAPVRST